jgi:hypothetical protein
LYTFASTVTIKIVHCSGQFDTDYETKDVWEENFVVNINEISTSTETEQSFVGTSQVIRQNKGINYSTCKKETV